MFFPLKLDVAKHAPTFSKFWTVNMLPFLSKNQKKVKMKGRNGGERKKRKSVLSKQTVCSQKVLREIWKAAVYHNITINLLKWKNETIVTRIWFSWKNRYCRLNICGEKILITIFVCLTWRIVLTASFGYFKSYFP